MAMGELFRQTLEKFLPGLAKPVERRSVKTEPRVEAPEASNEPTVLESGAAVLAKLKFDTESRAFVPEVSQDTVFAEDELGVYGVADGVGSGGSGDMASREAAAAFIQTMRDGLRYGMHDRDREELVREGMERASDLLQTHSQETPGLSKTLNTTFSVFVMDQLQGGQRVATIGHVGDSRVYHYKKEARMLVNETRDSSVVQVLLDADVLTPEMARAIDQSMKKGADVTNSPTLREVLTLISERMRNPVSRRPSPDRLPEAYRILSGEKYKKYLDASAAEVLYGTRNNIFDALRPMAKGETSERFQIKTITVDEGNLLFSVSDGISDVLTDEVLLNAIEDGLRSGKTIKEVFATIVKLAHDSRSDRQKGLEIVNPDTGERRQTGDDAGISGVLVARAKTARRPIPLKEAPAWVEDPGLIDDWERTLVEINVHEPDEYAAALKNVGADTSRRRAVVMMLGARKQKEMEAARGQAFASETEFIQSWKSELESSLREARANLREVYQAKGETSKLAMLDAKDAELARKEAENLAI